MDWYSGKIRAPLLDGVPVTLAGQVFVVAPFNIKRMRVTAAARSVLREVGDGTRDADSDGASGLSRRSRQPRFRRTTRT